jgi:hypothetical protein
MDESNSKRSRKWHPEQEQLFLDLLSRPEYRPIGGDGDGRMERKLEALWTPLLEAFKQQNATLAERLQKSSGMKPKMDFDVKVLMRKWQTFRELYSRLKKESKVGRHQLQG